METKVIELLVLKLSLSKLMTNIYLLVKINMYFLIFDITVN